MQTLEPVLAPPRTFTLPKAPAGDSAAARQLARALSDTADTLTAAQQDAHRILERARLAWTSPAATASQHPLDRLDTQTRIVTRQLRQAASALEDYAVRLDKAHAQHQWSWTKVLKVAAVVAVTTTAVVVTVGAAAPAAAAADAALVTGEVAATATAVTAATASAVEAAEAVTAAVRALRALRAAAAFLKPSVPVTAGLTDLEALQQVRRDGDLDLGLLARHAGTNLVFGTVGGTAASAVGGLGAEAANPVLAYLLPKAAQATAWGGTTASEELLVDGRVDPWSVATSAGVSLGGSVLADGLDRWLPTAPVREAAVQRAVTSPRAVNYRSSEVNSRWGFTQMHVDKHLLGDGEIALRRIDPGGDLETWLAHVDDLVQRPATREFENKRLRLQLVDIQGRFPRADGSGDYTLGVRLSLREDGMFDFMTLLTIQ